ncbi:hypothetical protein SVIOM74S_06771 [Streptomyces violarus]
MRMDRGKIDLLQLQQAHPAWQKKEGRFDRAICGDTIIHEGKVRHNNNIINVTRKPRRYVTVFWSGTREEFDYAYAISSYKFDSRKIPDLEELGEGNREGRGSVRRGVALDFDQSIRRGIDGVVVADWSPSCRRNPLGPK